MCTRSVTLLAASIEHKKKSGQTLQAAIPKLYSYRLKAMQVYAWEWKHVGQKVKQKKWCGCNDLVSKDKHHTVQGFVWNSTQGEIKLQK